MTVYNGIELMPADRKLSDGKSSVRIIFVGRLDYPKQPMLLLEAFSDLVPEVLNRAELFIVGDGPMRRYLESCVVSENLSDKVRILGNIPREKVFSLLRESDIFVLISRHEGFPISILEAMSASLPIIASAVGGIPEEVTRECGILVPRGDRQSITLALGTLIADSTLRARLGAAARSRVENNFSLAQMLKKTEEIYKKAVGR
jgi:glycosyltransferase involved in cell wall biosynthesis